MTKNQVDSKEENKQKLIALLNDGIKYHQNLFDRLNVPSSHYCIKAGFFLSKEKAIPSIAPGEKVIGFYPNELQEGHDWYVELYDMEKKPIKGRMLYKWKYNPHYAEELAESYNEQSGRLSYIIPVSELIAIDTQNALINKVEDPFEDFEKAAPKQALSTRSVSAPPKAVHTPMSDSIMDSTVAQLTVRELFAIVNRKPMSGNRELDNYILSFIN